MLIAHCKPPNRLSWLNADVDLKARLETLLDEMAWGYADLVRESGESRSVVSQWLGRGSKIIHSIGKMEAAERLEAATGFSALWIAKGAGPMRASRVAKRDVVIADLVRHSATLRDVARSIAQSRTDLSAEQRAEYLAALEHLEREAAGKSH